MRNARPKTFLREHTPKSDYHRYLYYCHREQSKNLLERFFPLHKSHNHNKYEHIYPLEEAHHLRRSFHSKF